MSLLSPSLEAFWAVVRKGTVQDASAILGLTQTGVTQRIRSLEKQLQITLFKRSRQGMKLTPEGEALLQYVKSATEIEGVTLSKIQRAARESITEVNINGPSSILRSRVIPNLSKLKHQFPFLRFNLNSCEPEKALSDLRSGFCDLAIIDTYLVKKETDSKKINSLIYKLYINVNWRRRRLADIFTQEVYINCTQNSVNSFYLEKFKLQKHIQKSTHHTSNNFNETFEMISNEYGYGFLPEEIVALSKERNLIVADSKLTLAQPLSLCWYPRPLMTDYFKKLIEHIK